MTKIKICGVTRPEDIDLCVALGVEMVGVNFHPQSPRFVDPRKAAALIRRVPAWMSPVGVFVDHALRQASAVAFQLGLRGIQWYGSEPDPADPFPFPFIPAFRIKDDESLAQVDAYLAKCAAFGYTPSAVLFDSFSAGAMGGTGHKAPWELIARWKRDVPVILAGGLAPENVAEAIRIVRPAAVDVASGVESAPGIKDAEKVERFTAAVRGA